MVAVNRYRFISAILIFTVGIMFIIRFSFYPVTSFILDAFGINYDFSDMSVDTDGTVKLEDLSLNIDGVAGFKCESLAFSIGRRTTGFLKKEFVISRLEIVRGELTFDSKWIVEPADFTIPETLPYFPLEEINISKFRINAMIDEKTGAVSEDISIKGNGIYKIELPRTSFLHSSLREKLDLSVSAEIEARGYVYLVNDLSLKSEGISLSGSKQDDTGNLKGEVSVGLSSIAALFNEKAEGSFNADFTVGVSGKVPFVETAISVSDVLYEGFMPWDIHAFLKITPTEMYIDRLNLFHKDEVFLSLDGIWPYNEKKIRGVAMLYRFDLDNCLDRMTTSGIVNLIVSGSADYVFSTETLSADASVDFTVNDFDVDNRTILDLPREVFVTGHATVGADGVKLHDAIVKTKDETSRLIVKDSWYGFADSMKFHIPVMPGSWINLDDVKMITGFDVKGKGSIEALVTSYYENPVITGNFNGTACHFAGYDAESCNITTSMKDFVLDLRINEVRQRSLISKNSSVAIDFNPTPIKTSFVINDAKGSVKDAASVFGLDAGAFTGSVQLNAEGYYQNDLDRLNAVLKADNIQVSGVKLLDSGVVKVVDSDGAFNVEKSSVKYGGTVVDISGNVSKKDYMADITLRASNCSCEDFFKDRTVTFEDPSLTAGVTGDLFAPDIELSLGLKNVEFEKIKMGNLSLKAGYKGESSELVAQAKLGKSVTAKAFMKDLDTEKFEAELKLDDFLYKVGDFFLKVSADADLKGGSVNAKISKLMAEQSGFFVRNSAPVLVRGDIDDLVIEKSFFDGETANFSVEGTVKDYVPELKVKGVAFPRMLEMLYPDMLSGFDGKIYFDFGLRGGDVDGSLTLVDGSYRIDNPQIVLNGINAGINIKNRKWTIENFRGFAGGGKVVLRGEGSIFPFNNASVSLKLVNLTGKLAQVGDFGLSTNLDIIMFNPEQISVSGDVELKNVVYNQPVSLDSDLLKMISKFGKKQSGSEIRKSVPIDLDLNITGKNNIKVKTNLVEAELFIDGHITGTTKKPDIEGTILLKNGRLEYKQNDFTIERGMISFEKGSGVNPYIDIESYRNVIEKRAEDEKEYKVIMYAVGYPFDGDLRVTFDSIPQLDQSQLISLLLWGNTGDQMTGDLAIAAVTDIMGITTEVKRNFRLSRFELVPRYSELDSKTILMLVAEKEIYSDLFLLFETNPSDTKDQRIELKYRKKNLDTAFEWKNRDSLENSYGGIGFDLRLEYVFE